VRSLVRLLFLWPRTRTRQKASGQVVGIDVGLTHFAVTSDGEVIDNPRWFRRAEASLAERQRVLERKQRRSRSRERAKLQVGKAHLKVKNQRLDHARKLAVSLFTRYDVVKFEKLNIAGMVQGQNLGKSISDAGWRVFTQALKCKAEEAGTWALEVDPRGTSIRCSQCGTDVPKTLADRVHSCSTCGLEIDRDLNAARNILNSPPGQGGLEPFGVLAKTYLASGWVKYVVTLSEGLTERCRNGGASVAPTSDLGATSALSLGTPPGQS
jgi:IS605 OrfB family transposase